MEYNIERIRGLVKRWLAGETTLAEEAALREFFGDVQGELPADLQPYRPVFGQSAEAAGERPGRKLALHIEVGAPTAGVGAPTPEVGTPTTGSATRNIGSTRRRAFPSTHRNSLLRRWSIAAAGIAAAVAVTLLVAPDGLQKGEVVCVVNGVRITDPGEIAAYTREALEIASDNLRKPGQAISSQLDGDPALVRVGEMLNELTNTRDANTGGSQMFLCQFE